MTMQRPYEGQILNARSLFELAKSNKFNVDYHFCAKEDYEVMEAKFSKSFENVKAIPGTQKLNSFVPLGGYRIAARRCSSSECFEKFILKK